MDTVMDLAQTSRYNNAGHTLIVAGSATLIVTALFGKADTYGRSVPYTINIPRHCRFHRSENVPTKVLVAC